MDTRPDDEKGGRVGDRGQPGQPLAVDPVDPTDPEQAAQQVLLRSIWADIRRPRSNGSFPFPAAQRAVAAGAAPEDVDRIIACAAYEMAFSLLSTLDYGEDPDDPSADAVWAVVGGLKPAEPDDGPAMARWSGLYESLLSADPTGLEGADLLA